MKLRMFQVDAFTAERFRGNPAAVIPLQTWLPDELMQAIAAENNLSETAFFVREADGAFHIRWFSPLTEIDFCGHATLASAFVLLEAGLAQAPLTFRAAAVGDLAVQRRADGMLEMSFPNRAPEPVAEPPAALLQGLGCEPEAVLRSSQAWFAVYRDEREVRALAPDLDALRTLAPLDVVVTAPANGGDEDPVTGSIHAGLAPYWAARLGRNELVALQASKRSGILHCRVEADRVMVAGQAVLYLDGTIEL